VLVDLRGLAAAAPLAFGDLVCAAARLARAGGRLAVYGAEARVVARTLEAFDRAVHGPRGLAIFADRASALEALRGQRNLAERVR
jgi:hypothetical protein